MTGPTTVDVTLDVGSGSVEVAFHLDRAAGRRVAIVGPNGAGKSSLLAAVAGVLRPSRGSITLGGRVLDDVDRGVHVPSAERGLGVLFQDLRLFSHMSVRDNVAFGLLAGRGTPDEVTRWMRALGLEEMGGRRPGQLSGGEQQRVALARALVAGERGLLLDEPMSAQDAETRGLVRRALRSHLTESGLPVLLVTHEPLEALALADLLLVLDEGRVVQIDVPAEVARRPRSDWVARLVGTNLLWGRSHDRHLVLADGPTIAFTGQPVEGSAFAIVHPRAIALHTEQPSGSPRNTFRGVITEVEVSGDRVRVTVDVGTTLVAEITAESLARLHLVEGDDVWLAFKAAEVEVYST